MAYFFVVMRGNHFTNCLLEHLKQIRISDSMKHLERNKMFISKKTNSMSSLTHSHWVPRVQHDYKMNRSEACVISLNPGAI